MILGKEHIVRLSKGDQRMISPFNEGNVRRSSYDLTVGGEYYCGMNDECGEIVAKELRQGHTFMIPPHGICFILSSEALHLPVDVTAKVSLRMSHVYHGLVLTSQPPFDPGYKGRVIVMIHNLSSIARPLKRGERVATIEFTRVSGSPPIDRSNSQSGTKVHRTVIGIAEQLTSPVRGGLEELSSRSVRVEGRLSKAFSVGLAYAAILLAMVAVPQLAMYSAYDARLADLRQKVDQLEAKLSQERSTVAKREVEVSSAESPQVKRNARDEGEPL